MENIYFNGTIITMQNEKDIAQAVLTENGIIKAKGSLEKIKSLAGENAQYINLKRKTMLSAFIDSHSHLSMLARNLGKADLSKARSFQDIVEILIAFREENALFHGEYIQGVGYEPSLLKEKKHPDKRLLDCVSRKNPVFIFHSSLHMGVANSLALRQAGIDKSTIFPEEIAGRDEDGEYNGFLAESAMTSIYMECEKQKFDWTRLYEKAQNIYLENGICTVQDGALGKDHFTLLKKMAEEGRLKIDTVAYLLLPDSARKIVQDNKALLKKYQDHLKIGGYKIVLDGSPQGKTAWLSEPYTDGTNGVAWMDAKQTAYFVEQAVKDKMQLLVHCNGDAASEQFLNAYEQALQKAGGFEKNRLRPVMIHSQLVRHDQLERFQKLDMIPSFFVDHVYFWGDTHLKNLGEKRAENISPVAWAKEYHLPYTFHQDTPVLLPNMLKTLHTAVERKTRDGVILGKNHRITMYEALEAITKNAAYQYGEEDKKGSIEEGKYADFVILDKNPLCTTVDEIERIQILKTVYRDEILYEKSEVKERK